MVYLVDGYLKELDAAVVNVNGKFVELDKTIFYPESGGQLSDKGKIICNNIEYNIVSVKKVSGNIIHEIDKEGIDVNDKVHCIIDWDLRYKMMRSHTAAHLLSQIIFLDCNANITGNQLGLEKSRLDFSLSDFDREKIKDYEAKTNEIIMKKLPVKTYFIKREEMTEDLLKLAKGLSEQIKTIRIVDVEGFDKQACGGCHIANTFEIGPIKIISAENKGKDNRRIYFQL